MIVTDSYIIIRTDEGLKNAFKSVFDCLVNNSEYIYEVENKVGRVIFRENFLQNISNLYDLLTALGYSDLLFPSGKDLNGSEIKIIHMILQSISPYVLDNSFLTMSDYDNGDEWRYIYEGGKLSVFCAVKKYEKVSLDDISSFYI